MRSKLTALSFLLLSTVSLLSQPASTLSPDGKCRVLALRGGGSKGAYEVGALRAITKHLKPIDYHYDVVAGVSIGAINGVFMAIHPLGDEKLALAEIENMWTSH